MATAAAESYARVQSDNGTPAAYRRDRKFFRRAHTGRIAECRGNDHDRAYTRGILRMQRRSRDVVLIANGKMQIEIKALEKLNSVHTEVKCIRDACAFTYSLYDSMAFALPAIREGVISSSPAIDTVLSSSSQEWECVRNYRGIIVAFVY